MRNLIPSVSIIDVLSFASDNGRQSYAHRDSESWQLQVGRMRFPFIQPREKRDGQKATQEQALKQL